MKWIEKKLETAHKMRDLKRIVKKIRAKVAESDIPDDLAELIEHAEILIEALEDFLVEAIPEILIEEITDNIMFQNIIKKLFDDWKKELGW